MVPVLAALEGPAAATGLPASFHESKSPCVILPAGPLPATVVKSIPLSRARWRTAGDASGLAPGAATTTGVGAGAGAAADGAGATSSLTGSGSGAGASSTTSSTGAGASSTGVPSPSVSNSMQT